MRMNEASREARDRLGANIEDLRRRRGLSVEALAERSQLPPDDLARILSGEAEARASTIYLLAGALDSAPDELFRGVAWAPPADGGAGFVVDDDGHRQPTK
jgi:transcriptional regulator with XRE-family HTH domain